jgi:DNA-binding TFAR19-related protein (PDSD5 family)
MPGGSAARLRHEAAKARTLAQNIGEQDRERLLAVAQSLEKEARAIEHELRRLAGSDEESATD